MTKNKGWGFIIGASIIGILGALLVWLFYAVLTQGAKDLVLLMFGFENFYLQAFVILIFIIAIFVLLYGLGFIGKRGINKLLKKLTGR